MEFCVLGSLEVLDDGRRLEVPPGKPRALLALLVVHAGEVLSTDRIVDELWGAEPPPSAGKIVQNAVSSLRRSLAGSHASDAILSRGGGYVLVVAPGQRDVDRFAELLTDGRRSLANGDVDRAAATLREALSLWRGDALEDFAYDSFAQSEIAHLEELRVEAQEELADAELALGRHTALIAELERLVAANPLRERLHAQLMLALYRSGRQGDSLRVFTDLHRVLHDELGIEPGRPLQDLQRQVLEHDPVLDAPLARERARRRRLGRFAVASGLAAAGIAAAVVVIEVTNDSEEPTIAISPNAVGIVQPDSERLVGQVQVPGGPGLVAAGGSDVWIENHVSGTILGLDGPTGAIRRIVVPELEVGDMAVGDGALWLVDAVGREVVEVDPAYGQVVRRVALPKRRGPAIARTAPAIPSIAVTATAVWVTDGSSRLMRLDTGSDTVDGIDVGVGLDAIAARGGRVWAVSGPSAVALEIAPRSGAVLSRVPIAGRTDALAPFPTAIALGGSSVWVLNANTSNLTKIDPKLRAVVATIELGIDRAPVDLAVGEGAVWTVDRGDGTLARIDARTGEMRTISLGQDPVSVAVGSTRVWASVRRGLVAKVAVPMAAAGAAGTLPASLCSPVHFQGPGSPDLLVALPLSLQGFAAQASAQMISGVQLVFERRGWKAGRFTVGFQACNDAERASGFPSAERCAANARAYVARRRVVGVVGPVYSSCSQAMLPILNAAPGGSVAVANGLNTYVGLTRASAVVPADEPAKYYPNGRRNYVRLTAADDVQAAGAVEFLRVSGVRRVFVLDDGSDYGSTLARAFVRAGELSGIRIAGQGRWRQGAAEYALLAEHVRSTRIDGVYLAGAFRVGSSLLVDLRRALGGAPLLLGADGFQIVYKDLGNLGSEVEGLHVTALGVPLDRLGPTGRRFVKELTERIGRPPELFSVETAAAAEVMLNAIAHSRGTRASVTQTLLRTTLGTGILGPVTFTASGDVRRRSVTISQITGGRVRVVDVIEPPARLTISR